MSLGLLILASKNKEDLPLKSDTDITYFKTVYKQYTNFSSEPIPQYFKTEPDFNRKLTINISKSSDLVKDLYLIISIPSIPPSNHSYLPKNIKKFKWNEYLAYSCLKSLELEIGGIEITKIDGEFLFHYHKLHYNPGQKKGLDEITGNISQLYNFSNGKDGYLIHLPINLWFTEDSGLSLPLVALNNDDIKINVEFNDISKCFTESPTHYIVTDNKFCLFKSGELIKQTINGNEIYGRFVYFDLLNQRLYYDKISGNFITPPIDNLPRYNIIGEDSKFAIILNTNSKPIKDESYFPNSYPSLKDSYLLANYIFLDNFERMQLRMKELNYLVPLVKILPETKINSTNGIYKLDLLTHPVKYIFWRAQLFSNYQSNDLFNFSSYPLDQKKSPLILKSKLYLGSIPREEIDYYKFYSNLQIYKGNFNSEGKYLNLYSFALHPKQYQPSGTFNFSVNQDAYIRLTLNSFIDYQNPVLIKCYAVYYNNLKIVDGLGMVEFEN